MIEIYRIKSCLQDYPYTSKGDWEELAELERLAEIGSATEKAFDKGYLPTNEGFQINNGLIYVNKKIKTIEYLLNWAKEDI